MNSFVSYIAQSLSPSSFQPFERNSSGKIIQISHWEDWKESQVDPELIRLNVVSLDQTTPYDYLCYSDKLDRNASGRLNSATIRLYEHTEVGGWWCSGLDPLNDWKPMMWGCFKPDRPRIAGKQQKPIKYEHPYKTSRRAFFLQVPDSIASLVADRLNPTSPNGSDFWRWVTENPTVPVILTEGAKKAACLLSQGYAAIALPGIYGGYSKVTSALGDNSGDRQLLPELDCIATPGRTVHICFDNDPKPTTRKNVQTATQNLGQLLENRGVNVSVMEWTGESKGIDDLVASEGAEALHSLCKAALPLSLWSYNSQQQNRLTIAPTIALNTPEIKRSQLPTLPDRGILVIASGKGTGKTNLIAELLKDEPKVISLGHRIALQRNICDRWNLKFKNDLDKFQGRFFSGDGYTLRIGLCIDSILSIRTEDISGGILVIDEFMQVLRHLFLGQTCGQKGNRGALIEHLNHLIATARLVILADADTCDAGINYINQSRSDGDQLPVLLLNEYVGESFDATFLETRKIDDAYQHLTEELSTHKKIFIATDSKAGSTKLAEKLKKLYPEKIGLLINSDTSSEHEQRAFITNPNLHVHRYDWIIATPSLGTGVSIEVDHFNLVYGIFKGVLTDGDAAQALNRVRSRVPRIIWAAHHGQNQDFISQSQNPKVIHRSLRRRSLGAAQVLRSQLGYKLSPHQNEDDLSHSEPSVDFYCELLAMDNCSHARFSTALKARLKAEGSKIYEIVPQNHTEDFAQAMRDLSHQIKQNDAETIAQAQNLTPGEVLQLSYQENLPQEKQRSIDKYRIQAFFCKTEITPEEVIFHGKYGNGIQQLEALLYGCAVSIARDQNERDNQLQWGTLLIPWDLKHHELKRYIREKLGLREFLNANSEWTNQKLEQFGSIVRSSRKDIKTYLNLTIKENSNNNWILAQFLSQIGLKTKVRHRGQRGQQEAVYSLDDEHLAMVAAILQRRQEYRLDQLANEAVPLPIGEIAPVSNQGFLYSDRGGQYEASSSEDPSPSTIFISTEQTVLQFKKWVSDQNQVVRQFFYPNRSPKPIEITAT
jgi:Domain of unknown function (DUF3854)